MLFGGSCSCHYCFNVAWAMQFPDFHHGRFQFLFLVHSIKALIFYSSTHRRIILFLFWWWSVCFVLNILKQSITINRTDNNLSVWKRCALPWSNLIAMKGQDLRLVQNTPINDYKLVVYFAAPHNHFKKNVVSWIKTRPFSQITHVLWKPGTREQASVAVRVELQAK